MKNRKAHAYQHDYVDSLEKNKMKKHTGSIEE